MCHFNPIEEQRERLLETLRLRRSYKTMSKACTGVDSYNIDMAYRRWQKNAVIELIVLVSMRRCRAVNLPTSRRKEYAYAVDRARAISHKPRRVYE